MSSGRGLYRIRPSGDQTRIETIFWPSGESLSSPLSESISAWVRLELVRSDCSWGATKLST
jgi:hypothetical protein